MSKTVVFYILLLLLVPLSYFLLETDRAPMGPGKGDAAPMLSIPGPDGDTLKLETLKGDMVLVYFWASWCRPCREKNPELVALYNKFNGKSFDTGKNFEIYSVSLDRDKNAWLKGIEAQDLNWMWHVSDLNRFNSESVDLYNVSSIPTAFLIDGDGKILLRTNDVDKIDEMLAGKVAE